MAGFTAETYQEALHEFQKQFSYRVHTILVHMGFQNLPAQGNIKQMERDKWGQDYFHIDFQGLIPLEVRYEPVSTVTLDRKPSDAAERVYNNRTSINQDHAYEKQKDRIIRKLSGTKNMQGLEIGNKTTVGTGEHAAVKVENETEIKVTAQFEQSREHEVTDAVIEKDTTNITVPPGRRVRVTQSRFDAKIKQIDKVFLKCDVAFEVRCHRNMSTPEIQLRNQDYKKTGTNARRVMIIKSLPDFRSILRGISPRYGSTQDYLKNKVIDDNLRWMFNNTGFTKIEESTFENASYGEVTETESALE